MQIQIEGRHLKITSAIKNHVHKKIDHLDKFFSGANNLHVILSMEPTKQHGAEIVCSVDHGTPLVAHALHMDMYVAIDEAVHKIRELLKKHNSRRRSRRRVSGRQSEVKNASISDPDLGELEE